MTAPELTDESVAVGNSGERPAPKKGRRSYSALSRSDKRTITAMVGIPTALHIAFVWIPAIATILLSFTNWNGFKLSGMKWVGLRNYRQLLTVFEKDFYEALFNNFWVLLFLFVVATPIGILVAYLLDKNLKGTAIYQSLLYFPVVLSLAVVGFIWKSVIYSPRQGLLNTALGRTGEGNQIDWLGDSDIIIPFFGGYGLSKNFLALIAPMIWQHVGYVMVLYLAGLKSADPALQEAGSIDGATGAGRVSFLGDRCRG